MIRLFLEALLIPAAMVTGAIVLMRKGYLKKRNPRTEQLRQQAEENRLMDDILGRRRDSERTGR